MGWEENLGNGAMTPQKIEIRADRDFRRKWVEGSNVAQTPLNADSGFKTPDRVIPRDRGMQYL